jgi:MFS family permease
MPRPTAKTTVPARRVFFGWKVVAAAFTVAAFTWGIGFYGPPIFLSEIERTRGWPITLISAAVTCNMLIGAIVIGNLASLHVRFGVARVTQAGAVLTALGLLGWALAAEPWQLFAITPLSASGWALTSGAALNAMVSPWFDRRRPAALSMAYNGASAGGIVFSPLWVALIATFGFPGAAAIVGAITVVTLVWLSARYFTPNPADLGLRADGGFAGGPVEKTTQPARPPIAPEGAWRDRRVITLAAASALALFAQIGLIMQLFSLLIPAFGQRGAAIVMSLTTVLALLGRAVPAMILRAGTNRRVIAMVNCGVQICGSMALLLAAGENVPLLVGGSLLFGLGIGNVASLPPLIIQSEFAAADAPRAVSLVFGFSQGCFAFAPLAFGALRTLTGDAGSGHASIVFAAAAVLQFGSIAALLTGIPRPIPDRAASPL